MIKLIFSSIALLAVSFAQGQDIDVDKPVVRLCAAQDYSVSWDGSVNYLCHTYNGIASSKTPKEQVLEKLAKNADWVKCQNRIYNAEALLQDERIKKMRPAFEFRPSITVGEELKTKTIVYNLSAGENITQALRNIKSMNQSLEKTGYRHVTAQDITIDKIAYRLFTKGTCSVTLSLSGAVKLVDFELDNTDFAKQLLIERTAKVLDSKMKFIEESIAAGEGSLKRVKEELDLTRAALR